MVAAVERDLGIVVRMGQRDVILYLIDDLIPPHDPRDDPEHPKRQRDVPLVAAGVAREAGNNSVVLEQVNFDGGTAHKADPPGTGQPGTTAFVAHEVEAV